MESHTTNLKVEWKVSRGSCQHFQHCLQVIEEFSSLSLLHLHSLSNDSRHNHFRSEFPVPAICNEVQSNNNTSLVVFPLSYLRFLSSLLANECNDLLPTVHVLKCAVKVCDNNKRRRAEKACINLIKWCQESTYTVLVDLSVVRVIYLYNLYSQTL